MTGEEMRKFMTDQVTDVTNFEKPIGITDTTLPLTIGEFRKGVTALLKFNETAKRVAIDGFERLAAEMKTFSEALKNVSGAKYHYAAEADGMRVSYGADTLDELRQLIPAYKDQEPPDPPSIREVSE